ncbi:MAG: AGE family epimerase/isomerase [Candidatus Hydrogenedentes bacterium]|nr:AGE family epimerase/isomerase [Candidatus Hydrogenedentota bacterium]
MPRDDIGEELTIIAGKAESTLAGNLMPFWATHAVDKEFGGFLTRLDRYGNRLDDCEKILIMQVRMIAALSMAHMHGLGDGRYLELATQGFDFVARHMWDEANGGFYFSVTRDGVPISRRKNTDFHGYALIGLCEYFRASKRAEARELAERVFDVLSAKAKDGDRGYIEDFDGAPWPVLNDEQMNLGGQQGIKTVDMHTNVLEGLLYLSRVTGAKQHLDPLRDILRLIAARGIDPANRCTITAFDRDWNPVPDGHGNMTTSYGLNVELAWLMLEAVDLLNEPHERYRPVVLGLIDHALAFGFDNAQGGLAAYGPMSGHVLEARHLDENRLLKTWWAQAELMNALVEAYRWTLDEKYADAFIKTFEWTWSHQIDHECGDWYQETDWSTGVPTTTDKGREWKTAFHAARALIRVSAALPDCL